MPLFLYKLRAKYARAHRAYMHVRGVLHTTGGYGNGRRRNARREAILPSGRGELQKSDRNCRLRSAANATARWDTIISCSFCSDVGLIYPS